MASISYSNWYLWAVATEPTLSTVPDTTQALIDAYDEASDTFTSLEPYLTEGNYRLLVYRYAMHTLIISSGYSTDPILKALYDKYEVGTYAGIISGVGDGPSSVSKLIPSRMAEGDAQTIALFATPYGKWVESVFQQLRNIAIVDF